jgi:dienelactone hydrolase
MCNDAIVASNRGRRIVRRILVAALVVGLALVGAACGNSGTGPPAAVTTSSTPQYQHHGPFAVGVTTLDLGSAGPVYGERLATVYYPGALKGGEAPPRFSYTEAQTLPAALRGVLPARYNTTQTIDAYQGIPGSPKGPFPVVLFSHGFGGERLYYSNLLTGIASWGYVVVSADYLERGLASQAISGAPKPTTAHDAATLAASLTAVEQAGANSASPLHGIVDSKRVAAAGHSAGGGTAFNALATPRVETAVGWAPVAPSTLGSSKPVMLIGAEGDIAVLPSSVKKTYQSFRGPKSLIEIGGEGHNTYTDICVGIRQGAGLINFAVANHFTSPQLAKLGINGCQAKDAAPQRFWPIVQYYTVFQLKSVFGGNPSATVPVPAPGTFPGMTVSITQQS